MHSQFNCLWLNKNRCRIKWWLECVSFVFLFVSFDEEKILAFFILEFFALFFSFFAGFFVASANLIATRAIFFFRYFDPWIMKHLDTSSHSLTTFTKLVSGSNKIDFPLKIKLKLKLKSEMRGKWWKKPNSMRYLKCVDRVKIQSRSVRFDIRFADIMTKYFCFNWLKCFKAILRGIIRFTPIVLKLPYKMKEKTAANKIISVYSRISIRATKPNPNNNQRKTQF